MIESNADGYELPPELRSAEDQYDRANNAEIIEDYEPLLQAIREMHKLHPGWRFGQIVANLAEWSGTTRPGEVYDVPDERLLRTALEHLRTESAVRMRAG